MIQRKSPSVIWYVHEFQAGFGPSKKTDQKHSLLNPQATDRVPQRAVWGAVIRSDTSDGYDGSIQCPQVSVLCALVHLHLYLGKPSFKKR